MADFTLHNFESRITADILQHGRNYFKKGKVDGLLEASPGDWYATVEGSSGTEYEVTISMDENEAVTEYDCDCPYDWGGPCKHVVATLLAIRDERIPISPVASGRASRAATIAKAREELLAKNASKKPDAAPKPQPDPRPKTSTPTATTPQLATFDELPDLEQRFVKIAALIWEPFAAREFTQVFNQTGFRLQGISLSDKDAEKIIGNLLKTKLIVKKTGYHYTPDEAFAQQLCDRDFDRDPDFRKIVEAIQTRMPLSYFHWNDGGKRAFREMRLDRYLGNVDLFKTHFYNVIQLSSGKWTQTKLAEFWLPDPFDTAATEALPASIRWFLLSEKLVMLTFDLGPLPPWFHYLTEKIPTLPAGLEREHLARLSAQMFMLRGDRQGMEKMTKLLVDPSNAAVFVGFRHLLDGHAAAAVEAFALSTKEMRRLSRNPKAYLTNLAGASQIMAMLKTQDPTFYPKIEEIIGKCRKNPTTYQSAFEYLDATLLFLKNEKTAAVARLAQVVPLFDLFKTFQFLAHFWVDTTTLDRTRLADFFEKLKSNGYDRLAVEMLQILADTAPEGSIEAATFRRDLDALLARLGITSDATLAHLLPRVEEWETALRALLAVAPSAGKTARENDSRLVWLVNFEREHLQPKEQTFGKNGWSGGRNVALNRLFRGEVKCATEQDFRIGKHVYSTWGNSFELNFPKAVLELVGHPLLFLEKSPEVAVQFLEEKPVLVARQTSGGGYELKFSHDIAGEGTQIVKESPTRYKLLKISAEQARIARAFNGRSLLVPDRGAEQLKQVVEGLAGVVTVQSAFEAADENLPALPADARTCLHLLPVGDGFHVEFFAKPFGLVPPYFKPGEGETQVIGIVEGERTRTTRDLKTEKKNADALREATPVLRDTRPRHGVWEIENAELCLQLLTQIHPAVEAGQIILEWPKGEKFRVTRIAGFDEFRLQVRSRQDWFEVNGELRVDEEKVLTLQELLELSEKQGQFVEVSPGKFLALTEEFRRRLRQVDGLLGRQKDGTFQLHALAAPAFEPFAEALQHFEFDEKFQQNKTRLRDAFSKKYLLPKNFNAVLRPYQNDGFEWLHRCAAWGVGACLADDMGLGKTIQALAFLTDRAHLGPALVAAPASVCRNWVAETEKFAPALRPILFGEGDRAAVVDAAGPGDLVIVTYDLMAREAENFTKKDWSTIILDEAQAIKNRATRRSETAMQLRGDFRMLMTGTPLENHLGELWNLFQFANPGLLGSLDQFNERFALPIEKYRDEARRDQLRRLVQPFILRRRKDEVLKDLPPKTEITLTVELSPEERHFYEALRRNAVEKLTKDDSAPGEKHLRILAEIMRLRRAACHPKLAEGGQHFKESSKLRLFGEVVEELLDNGHKALVFSQFVGHLQILEEFLKKKKISYQYLDGQTPLPKRQKAIEAFQRGEGDLFLISLKAGGVGLNLTAADYVLHMDPWWNPAVEDQATDRAHRIGQEKPVTVYRLVAEATIEEKILKLHEHKRDLADSLLAGADVSAKLNAEELLALLAER